MPTKKKILKKVEKQVVEQEKEKTELEESEEFTGKDLDVEKAPAVDVAEELEKKWEHQETERELKEPEVLADEGMDIESKEAAGEEAYPEIEEAIKKDSDEEEEE